MPHTSLALLASLSIGLSACAQNPRPMSQSTNPLLCDPDSAICSIPGAADHAVAQSGPFASQEKPVTVLYFTDPICSSCWGVDPQLRRLKMEYGNTVDIQYHMGGLLPSWEVYNSGGISKPSDVAGHWDEVSLHYRMPIIGDVWLEDALPSSYPPSVAFKAADLQDHGKALIFLRRLREQVFLEKKNITKWPVIAEAATFAGLDTARLHADFDGPARSLFQADLTLTRSLGVRSFPTFIFSNAAGERQQVLGAKSYAQFEAAVKAMKPDAQAAPLPTTLSELFKVYTSWCAEEVAVALNITHEQAQQQLKQAQAKGELTSVDTRNGSAWRKK